MQKCVCTTRVKIVEIVFIGHVDYNGHYLKSHDRSQLLRYNRIVRKSIIQFKDI